VPHPHDLWGDKQLAQLNDAQINWDTPRRVPCEACRPSVQSRSQGSWPPSAGSYASTLRHFERVLGPLPGPRTSTRLLLLFQDPRPLERNFTAADPLRDPQRLGEREHRYFCLTPVAWKSLGLDSATGSSQPRWPTETTAPHFLRSYLTRRKDWWSYDAFIAYFLHLFAPTEAYVTNLAKCHFGDAQSGRVFATCARRHLTRELAILRPDLVLSFTSKIKTVGALHQPAGASGQILLSLLHPAARGENAETKRKRMYDALHEHRHALEIRGVNVTALIERWNRDAMLVRG
jgi:hypothetical protein